MRLPQDFLNGRNGAETSRMFRNDVLHDRKLEVTDKADERVIVARDRAPRVHDGAGFVEFCFYVCDNAFLILGDDRNLLDGLKVVGIMVDHESGNEVYQQAHKRCRHIDHEEDRYVNERIEGQKYRRHAVVSSCFVGKLFNDYVGEYFRPVDTAAVPEDQGETGAEYRAAESDSEEVLGIDLERNLFEYQQSHGINNRAEGRFNGKFPAEEDISRDQEGQENEENAQRKAKAGQLADDDRNTGRAVVDGIVGQQDKSDRKAGHNCAEYYEYV